MKLSSLDIFTTVFCFDCSLITLGNDFFTCIYMYMYFKKNLTQKLVLLINYIGIRVSFFFTLTSADNFQILRYSLLHISLNS